MRIILKVRKSSLKIIHRKDESIQVLPGKETARESPVALVVIKAFVNESAKVCLVGVAQIINHAALVCIEYQTVQFREVFFAEKFRQPGKIVSAEVEVFEVLELGE